MIQRNFDWEDQRTALQQVHDSPEVAEVCANGYVPTADYSVLPGGHADNRIPDFRAPRHEGEGGMGAW